jgi:hypothetical protein
MPGVSKCLTRAAPSRVQRILSAFSRLDSDAARTAREGCDRAGERELRWYGKRKEYTDQDAK